MFTKSKLGLAVLAVLVVSDEALGRFRWLERDNRAVHLHPRRFGQEHPPVIQKLSSACEGGVCGALAGAAITPLLAAQPECSQQDMADQIIDAAQKFDEKTKANMIALAIEYRKAEKNTPPDFTTNPPTPRNSVFCQKAPKNAELKGLVQAQDPANGDLFFDPATKASVKRGSQPNTSPFGQANNKTALSETNSAAANAVGAGGIGDFGSCTVPEVEFGVGFDGRKETSFQPVDKKSYNHGSAQGFAIISQFVCDTLTNSCKADQAAKDTCKKATADASAAPAKTGAQADAFNAAFGKKTNFAAIQAINDQGKPAPGTGAATTGKSGDAGTATTGKSGDAGNNGTATTGGIGNFGSCTVPEVEFGVGFDGRKETSFQPVDKKSYNHGSAQGFAIISQFVCDTLTNSCKADQAAKDTCKKATADASAAPAKTGAQADAFNAAFGKKTNFASVQAINDQGKPVSGTGAATTSNNGTAATTGSSGKASNAVGTGGIGDFGSCTVPEVEFGVGFDSRKETSFQPVDKKSYNHGSAQNIGVIAQSICDTLTNSCKADQAAKDTCKKATADASAAPAKTGAQADAFNAAFGKKTNFASVQVIDVTGKPVAGN